MTQRILLIRMLGLGDVTCIGIPALRYFKQQFPDAEMTFLTFAAGKDIIQLAEPDVKIQVLENGQWPESIIPAMETFLGLAEEIIGVGYDQIINLDTWFMPCFLSRFLKDAGEKVIGNTLAISVAELVDKFQDQSLKPEFVNDPAMYMQSSFFGMMRWHTTWWESVALPNMGYPEFYLRTCCGFDQLDMDMQIDVKADHQLKKIGKNKKIIAFAPDARTSERNYPYGSQLKKLLEEAGYHVWTGFDGSVSMRQTLAQLKASDLLVTAPSAPQWLATTVGCPSLVICADVDPRTLMPEYATDPSPIVIPPENLLESIQSIFAEAESDANE
ncbi:hypothetical protein QX776_00600 [Alteromonadaceae bacterium BrNp21-10]|nr:hypothetical protein [Alteromonadaceae bacterium BrNp21-10]